MKTTYSAIKHVIFPFSEIKRIEKEAAKRIELAKKNKIGEIAMELFRDCYHYPAWLQNGFREDLTSYVVSGSKEESFETGILLTLNLQNDSIEFIQNKTDSYYDIEFGVFQLKWFGKVVLELGLSRTGPNYEDPLFWESTQHIRGYIPGDWELALKKLKESIKETEIKRRNKRYSDPMRLHDLKSSFGLS